MKIYIVQVENIKDNDRVMTHHFSSMDKALDYVWSYSIDIKVQCVVENRLYALHSDLAKFSELELRMRPRFIEVRELDAA
jgi:hypothetical protein